MSHEPIHSKVRELNAALKTALASRPRFIFQDISSLWIGTDGEIPIDLMADRCHPNPESYAIWGHVIEPATQQLME